MFDEDKIEEITFGCPEYPETIITIQDNLMHRFRILDKVLRIAVPRYKENKITKLQLLQIANEVRVKTSKARNLKVESIFHSQDKDQNESLIECWMKVYK